MFKRTIATALAFALVMAVLAFPAASEVNAQRTSTAIPGTWLSAILVQNVSTSPATVQIDFYDSAGTNKKTYNLPSQLQAGKAVTLIVPTDMSDLASGQYSAVVSSTAKVIASVQTSSVGETSGPWTAFAYEGVDSSSAAKKLFFPAQFNNYYGFYSEMVIQNTDKSTATNLSVTFYDKDGNALNATPIDLGSLGANRSITWAITDTKFASLPSGTVNDAGVFGAVITSTATNIAAISNVWSTSPTNKTASYNAFTAGSTTLYAPNLMNNYYGFGSALSLQNVDATNTANGNITYSNGTVVPFSLKPFAAASYYQPANTTLPSGNSSGSFSAKVEVTSGSIVGIVGFSLPPELNNKVAKGDYAYYNCPSTAAVEVNIPSVLSNYYGLFTGVSVQNTGSTKTNITLTYQDGKTWTINDVNPNAVANFLHLPGISSNPFGSSLNITTSAVASSSNSQPLVAVVQHNTEASLTAFSAAKSPLGDFLHVFTATPK
jgi:hypothetical protein